ncbi:MAG: phytoene/squalene synthase family protein [Acidobacteriaceae bacterium]|nr:phytoene/squalene synthase family protein [Acidobacteriaceae bacterium]
MTASVQDSYRICREIARREAKNFYYAFVALPRHKRDAICAVYAFMRHADDLSDDESMSIEQRRLNLNAWLDAWHRAASGEASSDPVFIALADAQARFQIPCALLDRLVQGTAMDLDRPIPGQYDTYPTFEDLYHYCYLVASVVGLVCIRIFGYTDPRAEKLAEETGIAFQLTNILRDVREDFERGRIYLPTEDLARHSVSIADLASLISKPRGLSPNEYTLLDAEAKRAEHYYRSGYALLPLISPDSRPALRVLIDIYHALLRRIERHNYAVFSTRISVPTQQKLFILARGMLQMFAHRLIPAKGVAA